MQVTPNPMPGPVTVPTNDQVARALPQVQAQAAAPVIQRAVDPAKSGAGGNRSRSNKERADGGDNKAADRQTGEDGHSVNLSV